MAAGTPPKPLDEIIGDLGPASSGGASLTQRVLVRRPDGSEYKAHAKFTVDNAGAGIVEYSPWGAVAELVSSGLARAIAAPACDYVVVLLPEGVDIRLRGDRQPAPGLAVAAQTILDAVDAIDGMLQGVDPADLARIGMLHALTQVGDHGGANNHIRAGDPPRIYSVDHASAFQAEHSGGTGPATLNLSALLAPVLSATPALLRTASAELAALTDTTIADIIASVPRQFLPTDEARDRLRSALSQRRDALPGVVAAQFPEEK